MEAVAAEVGWTNRERRRRSRLARSGGDAPSPSSLNMHLSRRELGGGDAPSPSWLNKPEYEEDSEGGDSAYERPVEDRNDFAYYYLDNARGQVMALLARDMQYGINTPGEGGGEDQDKARILEYYKYNAFGSVTVLPVYDRDDSGYSSVNSSGVFDSGIDDIPGSGSRTEWDLVENTPLTLSDNNTLMTNRRNGSGGHAAVGAGYGREGVFENDYLSLDSQFSFEVGISFQMPSCPGRCHDRPEDQPKKRDEPKKGGISSPSLPAPAPASAPAPQSKPKTPAEIAAEAEEARKRERDREREIWGEGETSKGNCYRHAHEQPGEAIGPEPAAGPGIVDLPYELRKIKHYSAGGELVRDADGNLRWVGGAWNPDGSSPCDCETAFSRIGKPAGQKPSQVNCPPMAVANTKVCMYLKALPDCDLHWVRQSASGHWWSKFGNDRVRGIAAPADDINSDFPSTIDQDGNVGSSGAGYKLCGCYCD